MDTFALKNYPALAEEISFLKIPLFLCVDQVILDVAHGFLLRFKIIRFLKETKNPMKLFIQRIKGLAA